MVDPRYELLEALLLFGGQLIGVFMLLLSEKTPPPSWAEACVYTVVIPRGTRRGRWWPPAPVHGRITG